MAACAENIPAQPQALSLAARACGALSVPRKKRGSPLASASSSAAPVGFGLEHRQAVQVRADAAGEQRVAIEQQVLRRDRGRNAGARAAHELDGARAS